MGESSMWAALVLALLTIGATWFRPEAETRAV
jgi:hypothetical protein